MFETIAVEVPQRVIGRIIGKGGKTIRQLCRISGTLGVDCPSSFHIPANVYVCFYPIFYMLLK